VAQRDRNRATEADRKAWWGPEAGELPTARSMLRARFLRLHVWCKACHHAVDADLQGLIDRGRGDVSLVKLRFRCAKCGSRRTDAVVMAKRET
jgi:hypothetical protein